MPKAHRKIALLSNITAELVARKLRRDYDVFLPPGFDTWVQQIVSPDSELWSLDADAVIVLLDGTEARGYRDAQEAAEKLTMWKRAVSVLAERFDRSPVFISTVDLRTTRILALAERKYHYALESDWADFVQRLSEERHNVYLFDLNEVIADMGRRQFYSDKMWYMSNMPYSLEGLNALSQSLRRLLGAAFDARRKVIALDLDNTLWGGVVGEDGTDKIELSPVKEGARYYDFQRCLNEMRSRGVLLAINSKNNPEDAEQAIREHPAMLLRDDSFVSRMINWQDKATNLRRMEADLNITESGFIFVDDNPLERDIVKGGCPEALVPDFPEDTAQLSSFAEELWYDHLMPLRVLEADRKKTENYLNDVKRKALLNESLSIDEYIGKLAMSVDIHRLRPEELERAAQLINKTNQFNLTTRRYTQAELGALADRQDCAVYVVYCSDRYGDNGLISVVILKLTAQGTLIDTFLMSCRVMGRGLESVIVDRLAGAYADTEALIGEYIPTAKNTPVSDLYKRLGFSLTAEQDGKRTYRMSVKNHVEKSFDHYSAISFEK